MSGLINPRLYFENLGAEARNKFCGIENNFRLNTSINLDNIFHRSVSGTSTHQMPTLNDTIRNEQQKINSQMNNFSKLLIPSYCSTTFPSPSQFIPIQSFPSIPSWQTLFKNNNHANMLQPTSIINKSNENSLTAHAEGEGVINESKPTIRKRRYSGTVSSDANGWQKDETNKEMVKRCKLTAKDEVDNKTTTNGKNKDNEISSPQPILKPQTQQQRLWRPFPL
uniref:Uncharacterized protein n=1 Tax=Meloidogyne incognita TaxID=6306 RepID=A0A914LJY2_MELIC